MEPRMHVVGRAVRNWTEYGAYPGEFLGVTPRDLCSETITCSL